MALKDVLSQLPEKEQKETAATLREERQAAISGKNIRQVVLGSVGGKTIPARYDPDTRVFYPIFKG